MTYISDIRKTNEWKIRQSCMKNSGKQRGAFFGSAAAICYTLVIKHTRGTFEYEFLIYDVYSMKLH